MIVEIKEYFASKKDMYMQLFFFGTVIAKPICMRHGKNILMGMLLAIFIAMPFAVHAELTSGIAEAKPPMHFMKLPPRNFRGATMAQRGQFSSLKSIARQQVRPTVKLREEASNDQPPSSSDPHKLLLYVYDEMR